MWKTIALSLLNRAMQMFLGELWAFLKDSVATYERLDLHPAQKRAMVFQDAEHHARRLGETVGASLLNLGIEAAIQAVRGKP